MKDQIIYNIESQIHAKQKLLKDNYKLLKEKLKDNDYLKELVVEYDKYNEILLKEQQSQIDVFNSIHKHISHIIEEHPSLTKNDIKNLNKEKMEITAELNKIK